MPVTETPELVVNYVSPVVQVIMNRPEALNALSHDMIRALSAGLTEWQGDDESQIVMIEGEGNRAFCAGGDVKNAYFKGLEYKNGKATELELSAFFADEYRLNRQLYDFEKPIFSFMDGIVMGGGFGIAGPSKHRICCENTVFAMPEVGIGFFPDVGSTYFLSKCPGKAGAYLALTGNSIDHADMFYCGLATHYVPLEQHMELKASLAEASMRGNDTSAVLDAYHYPVITVGDIERQQADIDSLFDGSSVEEILDNLKTSGSGWALKQADIIQSRSPLSLKVSFEHLKRAQNMTFTEIIEADFYLAQHFLQGDDFYEGVRAQLIDKDKKPKWSPALLQDATTELVESYFKPASLKLDEMAA